MFMKTLVCGRYSLALSRPLVMGVVNITPDSFSDGGRHFDTGMAIAHAHRLIEEGADLLDLGAESTRPGAQPLPLPDELARLLPVLRGLRDLQIPVSVDTYKPAVMRAALAEGASMINDIYGFRLPGAIEAVADRAGEDCALCIMHMQRDPLTMQDAPQYDDVLVEVSAFLRERVTALMTAGVASERMILDPGFGFGKTLAQNYELLRRLDELEVFGLPVLAGVSRKNMIGAVTGQPAEQRVSGSVVAALEAARRGARMLRVHDVAETVAALKVLDMLAVKESAE
jgi:dihydropteroate synthase